MRIIALGRLSSDYQRLVQELLKQIPLELIELKDYQSSVYLDKEAQSILSYLSEKDFVVTLEIEGSMLSTNQLVEFIDNNIHNITFVIGSSFGLSDKIKSRANYHLSLSKNTFSHAIARLLLVEQIYRYYMIRKNHPYHK
ncbi:MAG: 23S rRNA (pseudouridine(1915)-N(3))-methyltransferase RlmH [Acholeplasmatales bacterium]|jgi:23S rRNA (pseudouridine1915-N3)-methyltransferase|nr:23S rRNA (pseudouridine(1915)-N(3))-methyltransferase RlmH [Acholeplasmatales bacterium]